MPLLSNEVSRQPPKVIDVIVRQHIPEQIADPLARRNLSIHQLSAGKNLRERSVVQEISGDLSQRFARIEHVTVRIYAREHGGKTLERLESQQRLDRLWGTVHRLRVASPPLDDFVDQRLVRRIPQQCQVRHFLHLRRLRRKHETLYSTPVQQHLHLTNIPFLNYGADGDTPRVPELFFCQLQILEHFGQSGGL